MSFQLVKHYDLHVKLLKRRKQAMDLGGYREGNDPLPGEETEVEDSDLFETTVVSPGVVPSPLSQIVIPGTTNGFAMVKTVIHDLTQRMTTVVAEIETDALTTEEWEAEVKAIEKFCDAVEEVSGGYVKELMEDAEVRERGKQGS